MKRTILLLLVISVMALALSACDKQADGQGGGGETVTITLQELDNLEIDISEATVPNRMAGQVMIVNTSESFVVELDREASATVDDVKKAIAMYKATNIKDVSVDGGWAITYENESSTGKKNYWLRMRKEVGGKQYACTTSVAFKVLRDGALRACKTLRQ